MSELSLPQVKLGPAAKRRLLAFLDMELGRAAEAHSGLLGMLAEDDEMYAAPVRQKSFPFKGACSTRIPLIRIAADAHAARYINTIEGQEPLWLGHATDPEMVDAVAAWQECLGVLAMRETEMDMHQVNLDALPMAAIRGNSHIYVPYVYRTEPDIDLDVAGNATPYDREVFNTCRPFTIPAEDIRVPSEARSPEDARWKGYEIRLTREEIQHAVRERRWVADAWSSVKGHPSPHSTNEAQRAASLRMGVSIDDSLSEWWDFTVLHLKFDVASDGRPVPVLCVYHAASRTICRLTYRNLAHGYDPLIKIDHYPSTTYWTPGIARRLRHLNRALDTLIQQHIDNATLANTRFFKVKAGEPYIRQGFSIYPGARVMLNDTKEGLIPEQLGDAYATSQLVFESLLRFAYLDAKVDDFRLGGEPLKSGVPATSQLASLQESNRPIDLTIRNFRSRYGLIGWLATSLYQQQNPFAKFEKIVGRDKAALIQRLFSTPARNIRDSVGIELSASSATMNKDVQRQDSLAIMQLSTQYYMQVIQLGQLWMQARTQAPGYAEVLGGIIDRGADIFKRTLTNFDVPDAARFLVRQDELLRASQGTLPGNSPVASVAGSTVGVPAASFAGGA